METSSYRHPEEFVIVDFHCHSPGSLDYCLTTPSRDEEYAVWLDSALQSGAKVIVITDHNTFEGYSRICSAIAAYKSKLKHISTWRSEVQFSDQQEMEYTKLVEKVARIDDLWLIPGVEIEPHEGIHLLALFPSDVSTEDLNGFLRRVGVQPEDQGLAVPLSRKTSLDVYELVQDYGGMVIAAHIDSSKGLYNVVPAGSTRARLLCHEGLYGLQYNNQVTADKVKAILDQPEYSRSSRLSFVKGSDFHNRDGEKIGYPATYVHLPQDIRRRKDFETLRTALRNPDECVSPAAPPEIQEIISKLIADPQVIRIEKIDTEQDRLEFADAVAALVNSAPADKGRILLGVTKRGNRVGITASSEDFDEQFAMAFKSLGSDSSFYAPDVEISMYRYADNSFFASVSVQRRPGSLCAVKGKVKILKDGRVCDASPGDMRKLLEAELEAKYRTLAATQQQKIEHAIALLESTTSYVRTLRIARKLEDTSLRGRHILDFEVPVYPNVPSPGLQGNGVSQANGELALPWDAPARQPSAYWRFLVPMSAEKPSDNIEITIAPENSIIVTGSGAAYFVPKAVPVWPEKKCAVATVVTNSGRISAKSVLGFLKSSIYLWYHTTHFNSVDIPELERLRVFPFPLLSPGILQEVEFLVDEILRLENAFLDLNQDEQTPAIIDKHNASISQLIRQLDDYFFREAGLTKEEVQAVYSMLQDESIWAPSEPIAEGK